MPLFGCLCFFLLCICSAASQTWRLVRLPTGSWAAVLEVEARTRFLLQPEPQLVRADISNACGDQSISTVEIRLWKSQSLVLTRRSMLRQGLCLSSRRCILEPFQARTLALRDQLDVWKSVLPQRFLPIALPSVLSFELRRKSARRCPVVTPRLFRGLVIEIGGGLTNGQRLHRLSVDTEGLIERNISKLANRTKLLDRREAITVAPDELSVSATPFPASPETRLEGFGETAPASFNKTPDGILMITDCSQVKHEGLAAGIYFLSPWSRLVHCTSAGEILVLRRTGPDLDFNRNWANYKHGFGDNARGDFFTGLDFLSKYTADGDRCMRLILRAMDPNIPVRVAEYSEFRVWPEVSNFKLTISKYRGTFVTDPLKYHNNMIFSTLDRNNKGNCARNFYGGNWFKGCHANHLFGVYNKRTTDFSSIGMKSKAHSKLKSAFMTLRSARNNQRDLTQVYLLDTPSCPSKVVQWSVPASGGYRITTGGAAGGSSPHVNYRTGGRGAVVSASFFLAKGTKLGLVAGCQGGPGHFSGSGGDATVVGIRGASVLLLVAGGGGGAGWTNGRPGRKLQTGGRPNLAPGVPGNVSQTAAPSWHSLRASFFGPVGGVVSSGGAVWSSKLSQTRGGGGGGGYEGGWMAEDPAMDGEIMTPLHSAGGGGGSFCNTGLSTSCKAEEGGNARRNGFVLIEAYRCA